MSRSAWTVARLLGGGAILAVLLWRLGTGPFVAGFDTITGPSVAAAVGICAVTTLCAAWRWQLVARGLGVAMPLPAATAAYYRAQFLNSTLPGGVLGDVHRGVQHGRGHGDVGRGLRAVAWERVAGQVVQVALAVLLLLGLPSPVHSALPAVLAVLGVVLIAATLLVRGRRGSERSRVARIVAAARSDIRIGLLAPRAWPGIVLASIVVVIGHTATFVVAARTAGATASPLQLAPLAMLALLAMAVPTNVGGWGPREGVAAWAFAAAGLGADQGVAAATVFGVLVIAASLPGAVVLVVAWLQPRVMTMHASPPLSVRDHGELRVSGARG